MSERETKITARLQAQGKDGSLITVTERTTFLIKRSSMESYATPSRHPMQVDYSANGDSLIRNQSDKDEFRNGLTGETFRIVR